MTLNTSSVSFLEEDGWQRHQDLKRKVEQLLYYKREYNKKVDEIIHRFNTVQTLEEREGDVRRRGAVGN